MPYKIYEDIPVPESNILDYCTQVQIRYACGHSTRGEFIKCRRHMHSEDERCPGRPGYAYRRQKLSPQVPLLPAKCIRICS
ncbi:uncharacterized protein N7446_009506 [Penicillium canescens]|uniref:Uncharacterized protein n=1 Tax=Penicillium canescens TaxID=5083 RepID=A0AAD6I808_PENCN|nr:uncharacterized protein N7446_009506 [Penicillium canescens]KAJ6034751.1 hypothetical protein N7460_008926 [Penicillium canescens]KAJ6053494.1 hypothetical protein N7446_009506 [Penicillium canescens]KAJ6165585.1 hypothetical protein N7485_008829 [Penicillium canescens]